MGPSLKKGMQAKQILCLSGMTLTQGVHLVQTKKTNRRKYKITKIKKDRKVLLRGWKNLSDDCIRKLEGRGNC